MAKIGGEFAVFQGRALDRHRFRLKKRGKAAAWPREVDAEGEKRDEPTTAYPNCSVWEDQR